MFEFDEEYSKVIAMNDMDELVGQVEIIDIREPFEFEEGSIRTAINIPMDELASNADKYMSKDKTYYLLCRSGRRSDMTCKVLEQEGYDVINIAGGIIVYNGENKTK